MPYSAHDVALILSGEDWLGTGTLVAPGRIMTAYHVVFDEHGQEKPNLHVRLHGQTKPAPATVFWAGSLALDVAVVECTLERTPAMHPLVGLSAEAITTDTPWEALGYPAVRESQPSTRLEQVRGKAASYIRGGERINLDVDAAPEKFNGLSGGAVVIRERIVGVLRAVPMNWGGKRLEATPVGVFADVPDFRKALGIGKEDEILDERIQRLIVDVTAMLADAPDLVVALGKRLKLSLAPGQGAHDVARTLVRQRKAVEIAGVFNQVDADLAKTRPAGQDRIIACKILWRILPLATDWQSLVTAALRDFPDRSTATTNFVELPLRTETIAEIVMAGIDDRSCQYALPGPGKMPLGAAVVRIPAAARAALIDVDGSRLAECVVQDLATKFMVDHYKNYSDLREAVEGLLQYHAQFAPEDELLPYYLLFVQEDGTDDHLYALARSKLSAELPSLRLVRLTGTNVLHETILAKHIDAILRRS
ncbi:MAG TPA: serine protease [Polyangium sp.]|nr:serine protease [Polyangium sp.]